MSKCWFAGVTFTVYAALVALQALRAVLSTKASSYTQLLSHSLALAPPTPFAHISLTSARLILYLLSLDSTVVCVTCLDGVDGKGISVKQNGIE